MLLLSSSSVDAGDVGVGFVKVGVLAVGDWEVEEDEREEMSVRVPMNWRNGWLGCVVVGRRFSRRVADTVRHSNGSEVVRRRKASMI